MTGTIYAMTLDELIDSYDYSYSDVNFNLNDYDIKDDSLWFNITSLNGLHIFEVKLFSDFSKTSMTKKVDYNLVYGENEVIIDIEDSYYLENGIYDIGLVVRDDDGEVIFRQDNLFEIDIDNYFIYDYEIDEDKFILKKVPNNFISYLDTSKAILEAYNNTIFNISDVEVVRKILFAKGDVIISKNVDYIRNVTLENYETDIEIKLPDLELENVTFDNQTGKLEFDIKNNGEDSSGSFIVKIYDNDSNEVESSIIPYVLPNQSIGNFYYFDNSKNYFIYVDYYNDIDESYEYNNYWPYDIDEQENTFVDPNGKWVRKWKSEIGNFYFDIIENRSFKTIVKDQNLTSGTFIGFEMERIENFTAGEYVFLINTSGNFSLYIDGNLILNNSNKTSYYSDSIELNGESNLSIEYEGIIGDEFSFEIKESCFSKVNFGYDWNMIKCDENMIYADGDKYVHYFLMDLSDKNYVFVFDEEVDKMYLNNTLVDLIGTYNKSFAELKGNGIGEIMIISNHGNISMRKFVEIS